MSVFVVVSLDNVKSTFEGFGSTFPRQPAVATVKKTKFPMSVKGKPSLRSSVQELLVVPSSNVAPGLGLFSE